MVAAHRAKAAVAVVAAAAVAAVAEEKNSWPVAEAGTAVVSLAAAGSNVSASS